MFDKKVIAILGLLATISLPALGSDIIIDNAPGSANGNGGAFSYIGDGNANDHIGGSNFDVYNMTVNRSDAGLMTVRINTAFVDVNGVRQNSGRYYYGDLFMSTSGWNPTGNAADGYQQDDAFDTGTRWDHVYSLDQVRGNTGSFLDSTGGTLAALADYDLNASEQVCVKRHWKGWCKKYETQYTDRDNFDYGSDRKDYKSKHLYKVADSAAFDYGQGLTTGSVEANTGGNFLEFVFDVSGTDLASAEQIAFHWTMSCANDVIEGVVNLAQATRTPEPFAAGLLLVGLGGFSLLRRRRQS
ncbi:PEP-CTERM sorting domain-containing protein [Paremcibacter congregatus]|uniref:PEP-CTERM protein-sorting domain-containing protein n=1 Tax=Paremcibacter congregatus TaxID=2043170 RepID=A0A2G4YSR4_9PROT|nr:PEP-CTERM sorting domain-containing protein [Paremcibacter congregatus]PHZ84486.1 hypothetical protein CRD36_11820 [Paremcibacter congregatus]QDE28705.1 PEP-CTERM sorting domain-containing protein [Paremcibacter congregatus]